MNCISNFWPLLAWMIVMPALYIVSAVLHLVIHGEEPRSKTGTDFALFYLAGAVLWLIIGLCCAWVSYNLERQFDEAAPAAIKQVV